MNKIVKYLIVILSFLSISLSINACAANTDCRFGCEVLDVDTVDQTERVNERVKMICSTTITEPIKNPLWVVDGKSYGNIELDTVMLSSQNAKELIPMILNSIGISISEEEIKDYKIIPSEQGLKILFGERGSAGAITILPPDYGSAVFGVRGSAGAIVITTKKKKKNNK